MKDGKIQSGGWIMGEREAEDEPSNTVSFTLSPTVASTFGANSGRLDTIVLEFAKDKLSGDIAPRQYDVGAANSIMWEREITGENVRANLSSVSRVYVQKYSSSFASKGELQDDRDAAKAFADKLASKYGVSVTIVHRNSEELK